MFAIIILTCFVVYYPTLRQRPNGKIALLLRRVLPFTLLVVAGYFLYEHNKYGHLIEKLGPLTLISLIKAYAALWFVNVAASLTWILSAQNQSPWIVAPWKRGSGKLSGLIFACFLSIGLVPFLAGEMVITGVVLWIFTKILNRRKARATSVMVP